MKQLFILLSLLFSQSGYSQARSSETHTTIFKNEKLSTDSIIKPEPSTKRDKVFLDLNLGLIFSVKNQYQNNGIGSGFFLDASYKKIGLTVRRFSGTAYDYEVIETALLAGMNIRYEKVLIVAEAGLGKITRPNSFSSALYGINDKNIQGLAIQAEFCFIPSNVLGFGFTIFSNQNKLKNFSGLMLNIKFGRLR